MSETLRKSRPTKASKNSFKKTVEKLDIFPASMPSFNVHGKSNVQTFLGACITFMIVSLVIIYAILKLQHLQQKKNPSVTIINSSDLSDFNPDFVLTTASNFQMAIGIENLDTGYKNDDKFFNMVAKTAE